MLLSAYSTEASSHHLEPFVVSVQLLSHVWLFLTPWTAAHQASLSFTVSWILLKLMSIESVMSSNQLILCCPHLLLPSIFPSIRVFFNESALGIRWPKYWSFSFSISPSSGYWGLISFRIDWFDLPAVQGTLKFKSINSLVLSLLYGPTCTSVNMTTGKTIAWTRRTFASKVMCLLFNTV